MTTIKKEAAKDVATFATISEVSKSLTDTKAVLNQVVADLYVAHIALHQVHWYMRGRGFLVWHPKMDEYMESLDATLDEVSERLITLGGAPYASMVEFLEHSNIQEEKGSFERSMEENLGRVLSIFRYLVSLYQKALDIAFAEDDTVLIEEFISGTEYRFFVLDGKCEAVLLRVPANVVGDGKHTIAQLGQAPGL